MNGSRRYLFGNEFIIFAEPAFFSKVKKVQLLKYLFFTNLPFSLRITSFSVGQDIYLLQTLFCM